ncbi:MAG: 50S ribosomal protein L2 [Berkelbacteria bacterium GW2011_GWB1_38_5]|uniref:Large ribosomal subunit protein uL2 n=2 Tax=Candidatus Berkelbacteria TaxID=1618330 RepID=A0A0G0NYN1_9BACT|nr:MAG: 50S ribosomal protein L2 [Berkelbacteria bacterium GW2011_GWB1_38_5]KKQ90974.1 MAG: 50S ribosomal protein L2 [Berkelbacteria bacterium GW2011_GWA1_39_10]
MSVTDYSVLTKKRPEKSLILKLKSHAGRDRTGQISVRHQGGGEKKQYRIISNLNEIMDTSAIIESIEYDPYRSSFIALVKFDGKIKKYILAWEGAKVKDEIISADKTEIKIGNRLKLKNIPNGIRIFDIEIKPTQGGKMVRSAGAFATIVAKEEKFVNLKMPSDEIRKINAECFASVGQVSNITHSAQRIGKAGRKRHMGIRPSVRGKAMHPAAHPHGGGEGNNPIGLKYPKTPWGKHALGVRTRKKNKYSKSMIISRRKK